MRFDSRAGVFTAFCYCTLSVGLMFQFSSLDFKYRLAGLARTSRVLLEIPVSNGKTRTLIEFTQVIERPANRLDVDTTHYILD